MSKYLTKYIGTYRVKADYDLELNDYPRDHLGNIDPSFDDLYIDCQHNNKIYHYGHSTLVAYISSIGRGNNILKQIYSEHISADIPDDYDTLDSALLEQTFITQIDKTADEVEFYFPANQVDYVASLLKAKTGGAKINPFSEKNLEWIKYEIPEKDNVRFKEVIEDIPLSKINILYTDFAKKYKVDLNAARKKAKLKNKQYIHSLGLWNKLLKFIEGYNA